MMEELSIAEFRSLGPEALRCLVNRGFRRAEELEETSSTFSTLVFLGKHVAFEFSLDCRDQCVDAEVISVRDGKLFRTIDGGYSNDIYGHLIKQERYRGSPVGSLSDNADGTRLRQVMMGWASLLETVGQKLLSDQKGVLI